MKRFSVGFAIASREDIDELRNYLRVKASSLIARRYIQAVLRECRSLGIAPFRGQGRRNLQFDLRSIGFKGSVSIVFRIEQDKGHVDIVNVLYRGRRPSEAHRHEDQNEKFDEL